MKKKTMSFGRYKILNEEKKIWVGARWDHQKLISSPKPNLLFDLNITKTYDMAFNFISNWEAKNAHGPAFQTHFWQIQAVIFEWHYKFFTRIYIHANGSLIGVRVDI